MWLTPTHTIADIIYTAMHMATATYTTATTYTAVTITHAADTNMIIHTPNNGNNIKYRHPSTDLMQTSANKGNYTMQALRTHTTPDAALSTHVTFSHIYILFSNSQPSFPLLCNEDNNNELGWMQWIHLTNVWVAIWLIIHGMQSVMFYTIFLNFTRVLQH